MTPEAQRAVMEERETWFKRYIEARDALYQFQYPPDPKMLREIADEIDCGSDCEHGHTEWDTNAHVCSKSDMGECTGEKAWCLRQFADAVEVRARPLPTAETPPVDDRPTYDQLLSALAECREALPNDMDDPTYLEAVAFPTSVPALVRQFAANAAPAPAPSGEVAELVERLRANETVAVSNTVLNVEPSEIALQAAALLLSQSEEINRLKEGLRGIAEDDWEWFGKQQTPGEFAKRARSLLNEGE